MALSPTLRRSVAVLAVASACLLLPALRTLWIGLPTPSIHDELSYLLAADTFRHGRLANPTPAGWEALETFHVLMRPSYVSKYPPGQGLVVALGWALSGQPAGGIWLGDALLGGALTWMLLAVTRVRTAVLGAGIAAAMMLFVGEENHEPGYWSVTWYCGAVTAAGGALLLGAWLRLREAPRVGPTVALAAGLAVLATTRPFEGAVAAAPVLLALALRGRAYLRPVWVPLAGMGAIGVAAQLVYNHATTGSVWTMPYAAYEAQYSTLPPLILQPHPPPPDFRHVELAKFGRWSIVQFGPRAASFRGLVAGLHEKWQVFSAFFLPAPVLLIGLPAVVRRPTVRLALTMVAALLAANALTYFEHPHYFAPIAGAVVLVTVLAAEAIAGWRAWGRWLVAVVVAWLLGIAVETYRESPYPPALRGWAEQRDRLRAELEARPGRDLVLVRYLPGHSIHKEWVYNDADPAGTEVLWARASRFDADILAAYPDRQVWRLDVGAAPGELVPGP